MNTPLRHLVVMFSGCLCMCPSVCDHILKLHRRDTVQTARGNFAKFAPKGQLETKMSWLDCEVKMSNVTVTVRPNNHLFKNHISSEGKLVDGLSSNAI